VGIGAGVGAWLGLEGCDGGRVNACHAVRGEEGGDVCDGERGGDDAACTGEMVEQATRRAVGRVYGT
jgi:hypothetical protein